MINQTITHYKITNKLGLRPKPKSFPLAEIAETAEKRIAVALLSASSAISARDYCPLDNQRDANRGTTEKSQVTDRPSARIEKRFEPQRVTEKRKRTAAALASLYYKVART